MPSAYNPLTKKVLVLNRGYEPVSICSVKKAVLLLVLAKAEIVEVRPGLVLRSVTASYPLPSVIRLMTYVRVPHKHVELSRRNIMRRDGFRCQYCGTTEAELTIDHVIPRSRGGTDTWENLVCACIRCNNLKGDRTPEEAGMRLLRPPRRPHPILFLKQFVGKLEEEWRPYLFMD
ncbi:MAG: HNH endonuclease [Candidatus Kapabacteria bacterium]|nr:HNH endonuclease [Candidatus Kapabacteria bacterium]MDW8012753.1 HNH endonuclease [Bacteroidota bacterium]